VNLIKSIYLNARFFVALSGIIFCFVIAFILSSVFYVSVLLLIVLCVVLLIDCIQLYNQKLPLELERNVSPRLSLSDDNEVHLNVFNRTKRLWHYDLLDELPVQLQIRDFLIEGKISALGRNHHSYKIRPLSRGVYTFESINLFLIGPMGFVKRRIVYNLKQEVSVYPSVIQMKSSELFMSSKIAKFYGIKKMRRQGLSYEFDQIKQYAVGDDVRQINWKSSARHQQLMSNQFEDEKSQTVYTLIDKSRTMLMPFNGLSLLDYAINSCLAISNIALKKQDHVGLLCFSDKIGAVLKADRRQGQLRSIMELLYKQKERDLEADYDNLYLSIRNLVKTRSLLFLYTNFESSYALDRVKPILKKLNAMHLLVVIFFENSEFDALLKLEGEGIEWNYRQILMEQAMNEKQAMANELNTIGIQTIISKPEDLSIQTINKYLEIKSRGLI
jgi:uncharacterized protein (DUF58 family)